MESPAASLGAAKDPGSEVAAIEAPGSSGPVVDAAAEQSGPGQTAGIGSAAEAAIPTAAAGQEQQPPAPDSAGSSIMQSEKGDPETTPSGQQGISAAAVAEALKNSEKPPAEPPVKGPDPLRLRALELLGERSPIDQVPRSIDQHLEIIGRALSFRIPPPPAARPDEETSALKVPIDWKSERNLRGASDKHFSLPAGNVDGIPPAESGADDEIARKTELTLEKATLRDEIALNDLKIVALSLAGADEVKAAQEELYNQIREIDEVQATVRAGLDSLQGDLSLIRSMKKDDPGNLSDSFLAELGAKNGIFKRDLAEFRRLTRSYEKAAQQQRKQPKNDQLASKAGALGRQVRAYRSKLNKNYSQLLERIERKILGIMVDFSEYREYLGRIKDRFNRDIGFLIVYEPVAEVQIETNRKQLLEVRAGLIQKLADAQADLPDEDEVIFFRHQILGKLLGQADSQTAAPDISAEGESGSGTGVAAQPAETPDQPDKKAAKKGFVLR